jgi:hypothetical protein
MVANTKREKYTTRRRHSRTTLVYVSESEGFQEMKKLFMETTAISAEKTAGEILAVLVSGGATQVALQYENKKISALRFGLEVPKRGTVVFNLPARIDPVFKIINGRRKWAHDRNEFANKDRDQAERIAWRQLYRWVQAQVALIETGMVEAGEVFLPYAQDESGQTLWEKVISGATQLALPAPREEETNVVNFDARK